MADDVCFLSGVQIPKGQYSIEHVVPRSKVPIWLASSKFNLRPAIRIINSIKADKFLCEWVDLRIGMCHHALHNWDLKKADRDSIIKALYMFGRADKRYNPCSDCVLSIAQDYCYARPELAKYRAMWLNNLNQRGR